MEIKIDTKKDTKEDIQHMIDFLTRFISAQQSGYTQEPVQEGMFGMFGEDVPKPEKDQEWKEEEPYTLEPY